MHKPIKTAFVLGLLLEAVGQILLAPGNDFVYSMRPIDFAHWSLLVGCMLMMPQLGRFPNRPFSYLGILSSLIGLSCIVGMCVLDFIWWSFPSQEARIEFSAHISKVPSIWTPFVRTGPKFLNLGLIFFSLNYVKTHKLGVSLVTLATLVVFLGQMIPFRLIYAYAIYAVGFGLVFFTRHGQSEEPALEVSESSYETLVE